MDRAISLSLSQAMDAMLPKHRYRDRPLNKKQFKKAVMEYYAISPACPEITSYCHILGLYIPTPAVQAVHLVPRTLESELAAQLFGEDVDFRSDPENALSLANPIKTLFDDGAIVVAPAPGEMTTPTTWRCVVLDESKSEDLAWMSDPNRLIKVKDLNHRPLQFFSAKRPDTRYLFFRFILTYLYAKMLGRTHVTAMIEKGGFWPMGGAYLHKSTLHNLARCLTGSDLPDQLIENKTFGDSVKRGEAKDGDLDVLCNTGCCGDDVLDAGEDWVIVSADFEL